jgi:hypothetical protein
MAISTSSSQVGMGEAAGDGMICFVGWGRKKIQSPLMVSVLSRLA